MSRSRNFRHALLGGLLLACSAPAANAQGWFFNDPEPLPQTQPQVLRKHRVVIPDAQPLDQPRARRRAERPESSIVNLGPDGSIIAPETGAPRVGGAKFAALPPDADPNY